MACAPVLLNRAIEKVVSYIRTRYVSSGPQSVPHDALVTRMSCDATGTLVVFSHRNTRLGPAPAGTDVWRAAVGTSASRSRRTPSAAPMSPDVASTITSYDENGACRT